jgi:hypothetical protein
MLRYVSQAKLWWLMVLGVAMFNPLLNRPAVGLQPVHELTVAQTNAPQVQPRDTRLPRAIARRVRRELAEQFNIPRRDLTIVSASRETWPDACLGLAAPNERCMTGTVEGWRVEASNGQQNWVYRTDLTGEVAKLEPAQQAELLPELSDRLLQAIAKEVNVPAASLRITEAQARTWNGCMGIFVPDQMCTMIALPGYSIIVAGEQQSWVYHISADGSQVVQNPTASGTRGGLVPTFMPENEPSGQQTATIVFHMAESGGMAGDVTERFLTSDGVIYRQSSRLGAASEPVVEKRLSPQQVQQFQQVLLEQRFPNFDRLRYLSSEAFADYPTIKLHGLGSSVEYIDLQEENLPQALRTVIQAWQQL